MFYELIIAQLYTLPIDAPDVTPLNSSNHEIVLGSPLFLQCDYIGVPPPTGQWRLNTTLLADGAGDINIIGGILGDSSVAVHVASVGRDSGGTYTCSVTNVIDSVEASFTIIILSKSFTFQEF